jgi:hypothetical protein
VGPDDEILGPCIDVVYQDEADVGVFCCWASVAVQVWMLLEYPAEATRSSMRSSTFPGNRERDGAGLP